MAKPGSPLVYGLRMSGSVCLALFVAFFLQLDNPNWAGTSAGIVSRPTLGQSVRKAVFCTWFRLAQRVPARIHLDRLPADVRLVAGMTATVEIEPRPRPASAPGNPP